MSNEFEQEFVHLIPIAKLYKVSLESAKQKYDDHGEHGAEENDITLDMCGAIHEWMGKKEGTLKDFIRDRLDNWGYEKAEIDKALEEIKYDNN